MKFLEPSQYQPQAELLFEKLKSKIQKEIPHARIEHIGASSVPGCISKGDLDVFVGVEKSEFNAALEKLQEMGYRIKAGSFRNDELCPFEGLEIYMDFGIQLVVNGSEFEFFIKFRDILRNDESILDEYNALKKNSINLSPDEYRTIKSKFIERILSSNAGRT